MVIGKIPYLNSVPFYHHFPRKPFSLLPVAPRHLGNLLRQGQIAGGLFSLLDYLDGQDRLTLFDYCIASPKEVGSVLLFSQYPWAELEGKRIGITDDTATSVALLQVLLRHRHRVGAQLERMTPPEKSCDRFQAVLLIGDEALKRARTGLPDFPLVYDLATQWRSWQELPFVFAVWAVSSDVSLANKELLKEAIETSLCKAQGELPRLAAIYGRRIGLPPATALAYLQTFQYRLGEKEKEAIERFRGLFHLTTL